MAVETDGNDKFESELKRSFRGKDITLEAWIQLPVDQDATFFRHGEGEDSLAFGITSDRKLKAVVNGNVYISDKVVLPKMKSITIWTTGIMWLWFWTSRKTVSPQDAW